MSAISLKLTGWSILEWAHKVLYQQEVHKVPYQQEVHKVPYQQEAHKVPYQQEVHKVPYQQEAGGIFTTFTTIICPPMFKPVDKMGFVLRLYWFKNKQIVQCCLL